MPTLAIRAPGSGRAGAGGARDSRAAHAVRAAAARLALALMIAAAPARGQAASPGGEALERANALIAHRDFARAEGVLRGLLVAEPGNRRAKELLAFALESDGDLAGERRVRSELAAEFPGDPRIAADYGRVLERLGDEGDALRAYDRARAASAGAPDSELDAAIERMRGRTAPELGAPVESFSDPEADATREQLGASFPAGSRSHLAVLGSRSDATASHGGGGTEVDALAVSLVERHAGGAWWMAGPRLTRVAPVGRASADLRVGGAIAARAPLGGAFEADVNGEAATPWDEAAVCVLHGGRATSAEGHLYAHAWSQRLLLQVGGRWRRLSVLAPEPAPIARPEASESLVLAGADLVVWRDPRATVRGEILDDGLTAPASASSAVSLGYRHYQVSTRVTPAFGAIVALVPRGSVDEASITAGVASPRHDLWLGAEAGLARDSARAAWDRRAGGDLVWAVSPAARLAFTYEAAADAASGLVGRRRMGRVSLHVDL